jgi:hypothetical protein
VNSKEQSVHGVPQLALFGVFHIETGELHSCARGNMRRWRHILTQLYSPLHYAQALIGLE